MFRESRGDTPKSEKSVQSGDKSTASSRKASACKVPGSVNGQSANVKVGEQDPTQSENPPYRSPVPIEEPDRDEISRTASSRIATSESEAIEISITLSEEQTHSELEDSLTEQFEILKIHGTPTPWPTSDLTRADSDLTLNESINKSSLKAKTDSSGMNKKFGSDSNLARHDEDDTVELLDPSHPMLARYQQLVTEQLTKQRDRLKAQLLEMDGLKGSKQKEYDNANQQLQKIRQELSKAEQTVARTTGELELTSDKRQDAQNKLKSANDEYKALQSEMQLLQTKDKSIRDELSKISFQLEQVKGGSKVSDEMKIVKNAATKAKRDLTDAQKDKQKQDAIIHKLIQKTKELENDIITMNTSISDVKQRYAEKQELLAKTTADLQATTAERKSIVANWNKSLQTMKRKDEAVKGLQNSLGMISSESTTAMAALAGMEKEVKKQQEHSQKLNETCEKLRKTAVDAEIRLSDCRASIQTADQELVSIKKRLQDEQLTLKLSSNEKTQLEHQQNLIKLRISAERSEIQQLEDTLIENSESSKSSKLGENLRQQMHKQKQGNRQLEKEATELYEELTNEQVQATETQQRVEHLTKTLKEQQEFLNSQEVLLRETDNNVLSAQGQRDKLNIQLQKLKRQLNSKIQQEFGINPGDASKLTPQQAEAKQLKQSVSAIDKKITQLRTEWIADENMMIKLSEQQITVEAVSEELKNKITLLEQKKMRLEGEIKENENDVSATKKTISNLQNEITRLTQMVLQQTDQKDEKEQSIMNLEGTMLEKIKESEMECLQFDEKLTAVKRERERLKSVLAEKGAEVSIWETKLEDAKTMRASIDNDSSQEELQQMKADLHRLQNRYSQLSKQQETFIKDMERSVQKRESLLSKGEASSMNKVQNLTKQAVQRQVTELKRKIAQYQEELDAGDVELTKALEIRETVFSDYQTKSFDLNRIREDNSQYLVRKRELLAQKTKNIHRLIATQQRQKHYNEAAEGKYVPTSKSEATIDKSLSLEEEKHEKLRKIVETVKAKYPESSSLLLNLETLLNSY